MASKKVLKMVITSVMMALIFVATRIFQISTPTGGYIHLGDGFVFLSGIILGPVYGMIAGAIGSSLCDLLSGYAHYALVTMIVKGVAAMFTGIFAKKIYNSKIKRNIMNAFSCFVAGLLIVIGYFVFEAFVLELGVATALIGIYTNALQVVIGIITTILLLQVVYKIPMVREIRNT